MSEQKTIFSGQPSHSYIVEKMTATSTTSPKTDSSNDIEDTEIQNALDKKRKKRMRNSNIKESKHVKVDGGGSSIHQYFEASKELETTQRISQDLPNCNWLEQKIKLSENKKSTNGTHRINNLFGSDSEEDNLVVDDVFQDSTASNQVQVESGIPEVIKSVPSTSTSPKPNQKNLQVVHSTLPKYDEPEDEKTVLKTDSEGSGAQFMFSPPCITIAEEEGQQPIQIKLAIKGENNQFSFGNLQTNGEEVKSELNCPSQNQYNYMLRNPMKKTEILNNEYTSPAQDVNIQTNNTSQAVDWRDQELSRKQEESNEKIKKLLDLKEEIEKDIESLKNKKIQEMEQLIEIKTAKEKFMSELENLRMDVYKEKTLLDSFTHQTSVQEKSLNQIEGNSRPQFLRKPESEGVFSKSYRNPPPPAKQTHPKPQTNQSLQLNDERTYRYSQESVPTLAPYVHSSRPSIEQQHREFLEYHQKLYGRNTDVSTNSEHTNKDFNRPLLIPDFSRTDSQEVYQKMMENAARASRLPEKRPQDFENNSSIPYMGFQPPDMLLKPGMRRQYEQEMLERTRHLQQYPGLLPGISNQYSKGLPPLPADTTLSHVGQTRIFPPHSNQLTFNPSMRSSIQNSLISPPRPTPENVPAIETSESKCEACDAPANFMCSACKGAHYCSTECQRGHWMVHNRKCQQNLKS